jgi:hypothetical protein
MRTRFAEAGSLKVAPFDKAYDKTVGATVRMMRSADYASFLCDPAGVAAMILKVAKLGDMPVRILAGEDSYETGTGAERKPTCWRAMLPYNSGSTSFCVFKGEPVNYMQPFSTGLAEK